MCETDCGAQLSNTTVRSSRQHLRKIGTPCSDHAGYPYLGVVVNDDPALPRTHKDFIAANQHDGVGVSVFSCWEVATLAAKGRIKFSVPVATWVFEALSPREIRLLELTPS